MNKKIKPIANLVWLQAWNGTDDVHDYYEVARPGDKCVDGSDQFPVYDATAFAAKDAEIERLREALLEVMSWVKNWDAQFLDDEEWPETEEKVRAAIATTSEAP